jgi:hypothetical protein
MFPSHLAHRNPAGSVGAEQHCGGGEVRRGCRPGSAPITCIPADDALDQIGRLSPPILGWQGSPINRGEEVARNGIGAEQTFRAAPL